jgi:4-hydroxymandelate synthase
MTMHMADGSIAYVELYVTDAGLALDYFTRAFAFSALARADHPDRHSVLLASGSTRLVLTEPHGDGQVAEWLCAHGEGVHDIALYRSDLDYVIKRAQRAQLRVVPPRFDPTTETMHARVGGFGEVWHTLLQFRPPSDLPPGFNWQPLPLRSTPPDMPPILKSIDHIAICVPPAALDPTVAAYQLTFDMRIIDNQRVEVGGTATNSHVLRDRAGLTFVMLEPDPAEAAGQIDQFLTMNRAAGVQHLAFLTDDIIAAVRAYGARGVGFAPPPPAAYYEVLAERVADAPELAEVLADMRETGVLLDRDDDGALYQIFTTSPYERDTLFYELVERRGNEGFGTNNIVALFKAREADLLARSAPVSTAY